MTSLRDMSNGSSTGSSTTPGPRTSIMDLEDDWVFVADERDLEDIRLIQSLASPAVPPAVPSDGAAGSVTSSSLYRSRSAPPSYAKRYTFDRCVTATPTSDQRSSSLPSRAPDALSAEGGASPPQFHGQFRSQKREVATTGGRMTALHANIANFLHINSTECTPDSYERVTIMMEQELVYQVRGYQHVQLASSSPVGAYKYFPGDDALAVRATVDRTEGEHLAISRSMLAVEQHAELSRYQIYPEYKRQRDGASLDDIEKEVKALPRASPPKYTPTHDPYMLWKRAAITE